MARNLPTPPLSSLPLASITDIANEQDPLDAHSPKEWFERARYEAEKAVIAERSRKSEELFVAYIRACKCYSNTKFHPKFAEVKKEDPAWSNRVKDFRETYDAFLVKAKELKEQLKKRDVEHAGNGTPGRPPPARQASGPEVNSMGSIADRMKALGGHGMDIGSSSKRLSKDLTPGERANKTVLTAGAGNLGPSRLVGGSSTPRVSSRSRSASNASVGKASTHSQHSVTASTPVTSPSESSPIAAVQPTATGSSARSNNNLASTPSSRRSTITSPSLPTQHIEHSTNGRSRSPLPSIPSAPSSIPIPSTSTTSTASPAKTRPPLPQPPAVGSPDGIDEFAKAFPSLSEFGKQFEDAPPGVYPFERDPDSSADISSFPGVKSAATNGHRMETHQEEPELNFPDVSGLPELPSLPSVPTTRPGLPAPPSRPDSLRQSSIGPPIPDLNEDLKRPASTANVTSLHEKPSPVETPKPELPKPPRVATVPNGAPSESTTPKTNSLSFPVAQPHAGPSKNTPPPAKPTFPLTNSIEPATLRSYFLNPSVDVLLLDVRTEEETQAGYVGVEYQDRATIDNVWLDPNVIMRDGMTSAKLEDAMSLSTEHQRKLFENRNKADIVVVYDSHSLSWPRKEGPDGKTPPLARLWEIIYEHEFAKRLERTPVLLTGGYAGWVDFVKARMASNAQAYALANGHRKPLESKPRERSGSDLARRAKRDVPIYQPAGYAKNITDSIGSGPQSMTGDSSTYTGRSSRHYVTSPPTVPSRTAPSPSHSAYTSSSSIAPPPQASIHPGPGARRRSDYVEQHNQAYSGYTSPSSRPSIDYPQAHALAHVPQPPPAAQSHVSERHDQRSGVPRSVSLRGLDNLPRDGDEVRYWNDVVLGLTGLKNLGNTCYMNSTLQCLSATYPFTAYFLDGSYKKSINVTNPLGMKGNLAKAFAELLKALWKEDYTFLSPVTFRKQIVSFANQFSGTDQHDSQEFLSFVLDGLHEDLNRIKNKPPPVDMTPEREAALETLPPEVASEKEWQIYRMRNDSFIVDLFQGQYRNRLECLTCHKTSTTYDTFMYLSLPVPAGRNKVVLQELIDEFVKPELLDGADAWNCPRCKVPRRATKTLTISRLPPVLLIQLKRFTTKNGVFWDKSETPVIFPVKSLDLTRYLPYRQPTGREDVDDPRTQIGPFRYDLYGVSNHMGTLSSGHYTAFVKSSKGWKYCEDSKTTDAQERDVVSRPAYILFYKRIRERRV